MRYYPLFLDLKGARCLVAGAGAVGRRKISGLLDSASGEVGVEVLVVDPVLTPELEPLLARPNVRFERRPFQPGDLDGCALAFAATSSRETNRAIAQACREAGIPCNVADAPEESSFLVPARVENGSITLALSTGGASPALAKALKEDLEKWLGQRYSRFACLLEKLRPRVLALRLGSEADAKIFRALASEREHLAALLAARDDTGCEAALRRMLPAALHPSLAELLHELD